MSRIQTLIERIRHLDGVPTEDDDDGLEVLPPASDGEQMNLRRICGGTLPGELEEMLRCTAGFEHTFLDWKPEPESVEGQAFFGPLLRASHLGNGDGFAIEPVGERCRVWWVGHDPWFLIYWAPSIETFLELWLERAMALKGDDPPFDAVWSPLHASDVAARDTGDVELRSFYDTLPHGSVVHDLRNAPPGTEIPFARLESLATGGSLRRQDLLLGFVPPSR